MVPFQNPPSHPAGLGGPAPSQEGGTAPQGGVGGLGVGGLSGPELHPGGLRELRGGRAGAGGAAGPTLHGDWEHWALCVLFVQLAAPSCDQDAQTRARCAEVCTFAGRVLGLPPPPLYLGVRAHPQGLRLAVWGPRPRTALVLGV